jgi:hypothetical protein
MELLYMTRNYVIPRCQLQLDTHKTTEKVKIIFSLVWGLFSSMPFHRFHYAFAFIKYEVIKACVRSKHVLSSFSHDIKNYLYLNLKYLIENSLICTNFMRI